MQGRAIQRSVRQSPRKMRLVMDLIRGKNVNEAYAILQFNKKLAAKQIAKTLKSAIANAENNKSLKPESLRVKEAVTGSAMIIKRFMPKARGSAGPILKRRCHIKITLSDE